MPEFFDFDPVRGITETWDYDEMTGTAVIHQSQDVEAVLKVAAEGRARALADKAWKKSDVTLYASIPPVVEYELMKRGIDIYKLNDPEMDRRFTRVIETEYPFLKGSDKKAWRPQ